MKIIYWSDYACPYCYIGEERLGKAVAEMGLEKEVQYEPRAFELDPAAPREVVSDTASRFAAKYRLPLAEAEAQIAHISALGQAEGIDFRYATTLYTNTFDAHRLMKFALSLGDAERAAETNRLLFDAYFTKNLKLAEASTLLQVAGEAGLPEDATRAMLASDRFGAEVRDDEKEAARRGVRGVPYFVFEDGFTVPGALSVADFRSALERALLAGGREGMSGQQCGPDGCLI